MKLVGSLLVALGAVALYYSWRREARRSLCQGEALMGDLAVLRREMCLCRRSLPDILERELAESAFTGLAWRAMLENLEGDTDVAWSAFLTRLSSSFAPALSPLRRQLWTGGDMLARALDETREELARCLQQAKRADSERARLGSALCFSAAVLLILVLI